MYQHFIPETIHHKRQRLTSLESITSKLTSSSSQTIRSEDADETTPESSDLVSYVLLTGPYKCGKTSLLFQFATNLSLTSSGKCLFICNKHDIYERKPMDIYLEEGGSSEASKGALRNVHMKYVASPSELQEMLLEIHRMPWCPSGIVIDSLDRLVVSSASKTTVSHELNHQLFYFLSLLSSGINALTKQHNINIACCVSLTCDTVLLPAAFAMLSWTLSRDHFYIIHERKHPMSSKSDHIFEMREHDFMKNALSPAPVFCYSISQGDSSTMTILENDDVLK